MGGSARTTHGAIDQARSAFFGLFKAKSTTPKVAYLPRSSWTLRGAQELQDALSDGPADAEPALDDVGGLAGLLFLGLSKAKSTPPKAPQ